MKTIGKLKLTQLSKAELEARQMNTLKGGYCVCDESCTCPCYQQSSEDHTSSYNMDYCDTNGDDQGYVGGPNTGCY